MGTADTTDEWCCVEGIVVVVEFDTIMVVNDDNEEVEGMDAEVEVRIEEDIDKEVVDNSVWVGEGKDEEEDDKDDKVEDNEAEDEEMGDGNAEDVEDTGTEVEFDAGSVDATRDFDWDRDSGGGDGRPGERGGEGCAGDVTDGCSTKANC